MKELAKFDFNGEVIEITDEVARKSIENLQEAQETQKTHEENTNNPHAVTKEQVGLGNVDNTSDADKPVSTAQQRAIDEAYANSNFYTDEKIADLIGGAPDTLDTLKEIVDAMAENEDVVDALNDAIGTKANENEFNAHVNNVSNPHNVTKEQVGLGNVENLAINDQTPSFTESSTLVSLMSGEKLSVSLGKLAKAVKELLIHINSKNNPHTVKKSQVGLSNVDNTSDADKPVSTAQQMAINGKADSSTVTAHIDNSSNPHGVTAEQVGLGNVPNVATNDQTPTYTILTDIEHLIPGEKLSEAFGKLAGSILNLQAHMNNKSNPHEVTKTQLGLGNVPNVPTNGQTPTYSVSATLRELSSGETLQVAFGKIAKAISELISHIGNKSNPHAVSKTQIGLGNVDNTSDADKPISTAVSNALSSQDIKINMINLKENENSEKITALETRSGGMATYNAEYTAHFENGQTVFNTSLDTSLYSQLRGCIVNGFGTGHHFVASVADAAVDHIGITIRCVSDVTLTGDEPLSITMFLAATQAATVEE